MSRQFIFIIVLLVCVAGGAAVWRIASLHGIRAGVADYTFDLDAQKQVTKTIRPEVGDIILLQGMEGSDGGYKWEAQKESTPIYKMIDSSFEVPDQKPGVVGANGIRKMKFEVVGEGNGKLVIEHRQPWVKNVSPTGSLTLVFE